jgi:hypothetical protein
MQLTGNDIKQALTSPLWDLANQVLYDLCRVHPRHQTDGAITAKIWLIGRAYAASIERRRKIQHRGDDFYARTVAPTIRASALDTWLAALPKQATFNQQTVALLLATHRQVTRLFSRISGLDKRSLASKYLHFHRPDLFYIYDSRATRGIRALLPRARHNQAKFSNKVADVQYASFFLRCRALTELVHEEFCVRLTPRQLDNLLLIVSARLNN